MFQRLFKRFRDQEASLDPVCHMTVDSKNPGGGVWRYANTTYYFCGPGCRVAFREEPEEYLSGRKGGHM